MGTPSNVPSFIIAGAMRSGTTALSSWLADHPGISFAAVKEVHYFDRNYDRGPAWYAAQFETEAHHTAVGEATPNYLYHRPALERMAVDLPDVQVLVLLRDPVSRAYSHYLHRQSRGTEQLSFLKAIEAEPERLATSDERTQAFLSYVDRGRYLNQLQHLFDLVPRERVMIRLYEDLRDSPASVFADVVEFLGVSPADVPASVGSRVNGYQRFRSRRVQQATKRLPLGVRRLAGRMNRVVGDYPEMPEPAVQRLREIYGRERAELAQLLDRSLSEWR